MGKKLQKGKKGEKSQYLTRSKAIRKLQLSLKDFRRLCILKGVYPREPKKKFEGTNKTYYHIKDLKILMHEKLLHKFREIKAHLKKHKKLLGKKENKLAEDHMRKLPKYSLAHIIKERYPSMVDALRDLDDALCLISLFANLPQHHTLEITKKETEECSKLIKEFMLYCTVTQCFKKAFFSIKGIYYQVEIMGQNITWVAPYAFNQKLPFDIDYKVMSTFLEFYVALLKFVNFKLFSDLGFKYPPEYLQQARESQYLDCDEIQALQKQARKKFEQGQHGGAQTDKYSISEEFKETPEMKKLTKKEEQLKKQRQLFSKCVFYLNRETPVYCLQYLVLSFGGVFVLDEEDKLLQKYKVTHHVMDRPLAGKMLTTREYVQPQWIVDSLNNLYLLPTQSYKPGSPPPPHLSPFVDNAKEGYIPNRQKEINSLKGEVISEGEDEFDDEDMEESSEEPQPQPKVQKQKQEPVVSQQQQQKKQPVKGDADTSSDEDQSQSEEDEVQQVKQKKIKNQKLKKELKKEQEELGKILMTKKQRRLLEQVDKGNQKQKQIVNKLKEKRKKIESSKKK